MVKNFIKKHKFEKTPFYASSLGNGLNKFQFENYLIYDNL